ncbi:MAG: glycosyltransferase [Solirubrobacteraceae bacterium]
MRILFSSMSAQSHITPMLPLAGTAAEAGHDVVFATGPDAVAAVRRCGLEAVPAGLPFAEVQQRYSKAHGSGLAGLSPQERLAHLLRYGLLGIAAPAMLEDLLPYARALQPDLVIRNLGEPAAEVVAAAVSCPTVIHGFSSPKSSYFAATLETGLAELYERCGIDPSRGDSRLGTPYLDIWPEGLHAQAEDWQYPNMWPLRPENALPLAAPVPRPSVLDGLPYERTVYVTAGTTHNSTPGLLETMLEGLCEEAVNVVVTIGPDGDPNRFGPQLGNVRVERWIDQRTILPHCEAVLCNAGAGTVLGALAHATPLVLAPIATDQYEMAAQIEHAGAGLVCSTQPLSPAAVREAFHQVSSNPACSTASAWLRDQIVSMPAPEDLIPRLAELITNRSAPFKSLDTPPAPSRAKVSG